ncbi:hypothetical protein [Neobacillus sp. 19]|uniref:hypothetical protein n=1 Tax=Neobacillus sp. 19 TaxID=3394458 RepID=UPI003BF769BB
MVDLPALLDTKRKHDALNRLNEVSTLIATGNRAMDDAEYKKFIDVLSKETGVKAPEKFDRAKFEQLRAMANMGGNKSR